LRPKPAYFTIARELRPYTIGMARKDVKTFADDRTATRYTVITALEIWGTNSTLEERKAVLQVNSFDLSNPEWTHSWKQEIVLAPNASTELWKGEVPGQPVRTKASEIPKPIIVSARLVDAKGAVLGRYSNWSMSFHI